MRTLKSLVPLVAVALVQNPPAALRAQPPSSQQQQVSEGLKLQAGRAERVVSRGKKAYYNRQFDLTGLPSYKPAQRVTGNIRMWGSNYLKDGNLADYWEASFKKFHPGVTFDYHLKTSLAAVPALVTGVADLGPNRKITFAETLLYERYFNRDPLEIVYATGSFDVPGWQPAYGILVQKKNPISGLTMKQLDGIFGAERRGGWVGTSWHPEFARGPEENIRTWGQLGLTGEWAGKRINVYGLNLRYHQATVISDVLLKSSDKWNESLRIYANEILPDGTFGRLMVDDLVADPYCIAYVAAPSVNLPSELKLVPLAAKDGGPFVDFTIESVQSRTYPMSDEVYMYANVLPDTGVDPKVKEFLRFILSREGQQDVMRDGKYLPLTPELARDQLKKLELPGPGRSQDSPQRVAGTIRNFGSGFAGMMKDWEEGFRKIQPDVRFDDNLRTSDAAFPALVTGAGDLGPDGGEPTLTEMLSFFEVHGYDATQITVATGAYDVEGRSNGLVIYVHKDNPIDRLTMKQLDGIFGAERTAGLRGFKWTLSDGRGPERNIRTWGQLGLSGEWADKPIQTYGHAPSGTSRFFQLKVLGNGDKWNPNFREYVETGSKMIGDDDRVEQLGGLQHMLANELAHDRYGIAWTVIPQAHAVPGLKPLALAAADGGPYVAPSRESFEDRTYPLARSIYIYLNRQPGRALDPKLAEFLRYILSREGQAIVKRNHGYLPLPDSVVREQLRKLE